MDEGAHQNIGLNGFSDAAREVVNMIDTMRTFTQDIVDAESLEHCFLLLKSVTKFGPFFAWQIFCDYLELKMINDDNIWICFVPGA